MRAGYPVLLENRIRVGDLRFFGIPGGARIFVDQATQDGFSEDPSAVEVGNGEVATVVLTVGDALSDALVRPGRVRSGFAAANSLPSTMTTRSRPGGSREAYLACTALQ